MERLAFGYSEIYIFVRIQRIQSLANRSNVDKEEGIGFGFFKTVVSPGKH